MKKLLLAFCLFICGTACADIIGGTGSGGGPIQGVTDGSYAAAGFVGQVIGSTVTLANRISAPTSTAFGDVTSISLTAGDWDISGCVGLIDNGATVTNFQGCAGGTASGSSSAGCGDGLNLFTGAVPSGGVQKTFCTGPYQLSFSATTTVYLKCQTTYTVATPQMWGSIRARRMR